jgi:SAM-dependent methyltransferase
MLRVTLQDLYRLPCQRLSLLAKDSSDAQFIVNHLVELSIALLSPFLNGPILDVGCGSRPYDSYFTHMKKINCDFDSKRGQVDVECPATELPFADASFNSILCTEVLEHVPEPQKALREFYRVLQPGGRALVSVPMWWPAHELPYDFYRYPEHGLRYLAESAGFRVLRLIPRGGIYALIGQIIMLGFSRYLPARVLRSFWNLFFLKLDAKRLNPSMTLGWTMLVER